MHLHEPIRSLANYLRPSLEDTSPMEAGGNSAGVLAAGSRTIAVAGGFIVVSTSGPAKLK